MRLILLATAVIVSTVTGYLSGYYFGMGGMLISLPIAVLAYPVTDTIDRWGSSRGYWN